MDPQKPTQKVINPIKRPSDFLSLEYGFAIVAALVSLLASVSTITTLMSLWARSSSDVVPLTALIATITKTNYSHTITVSLAAVIFGFVALILFGRVSRAVASSRPAYTGRVSYKVLTYLGFSVLVVVSASLVVSLLGILLSSLILIGADAGIGDMYVHQFVPQLIALVFVAAATWLFYGIVRGQNTSKLLSLGLVGLGSALLVATIITTAVHSHSSNSSSDGSADITRPIDPRDKDSDSQTDIWRDFEW